MMPTLLKLALSGTALVAALYDLRLRRIPNWLNLSGIILGFGLNTYFLAGRGATLASLGCLLALAVYTPLYLLRGMGAGDVKLMAAIGAIAGPANWFNIFLATALLGGALSIFLIVLRRRFHLTLLNISIILGQLSHRRSPALADSHLDIRSQNALTLPHGAVIAAAVFLFLLLQLRHA
jgi:prepilin peptidase CpaA